MGLSEDVISREGIIASMEDVALKQFLFLRNLAEPVLARWRSWYDGARQCFQALWPVARRKYSDEPSLTRIGPRRACLPRELG